MGRLVRLGAASVVEAQPAVTVRSDEARLEPRQPPHHRHSRAVAALLTEGCHSTARRRNRVAPTAQWPPEHHLTREEAHE
eukprot:scaffold16150_cov46-Phaeocystis_antarctica.AAC.3